MSGQALAGRRSAAGVLDSRRLDAYQERKLKGILGKGGKGVIFYVTNDYRQPLADFLASEGISFNVAAAAVAREFKNGTLEVFAVEAQLLEVDVPTIYTDKTHQLRRAYRLPSNRFIITDVEGLFEMAVGPQTGW
jgi:hypothetical protein